MRMSLIESLRVLHEARTSEVVLTTMGSAREWMKLGSHPLDFVYAPSAMGELPALALGLALAQPDRKVIACNGDGCMLMNLGSLATISAAAPANLLLIVFSNGIYEVTGGQQTAGQRVNYNDVAYACGILSVHEFRDLAEWKDALPGLLNATGPTFITLHVEPVVGGDVPKSPAPPIARAKGFAQALQA